MNLRIFIILFFLNIVNIFWALEFKVESCELDFKDLHNATGKVVDANYDPCAVLRVETDVKPDLYLSGPGVIKKEDVAQGIYYFFVSFRKPYITFSAEGYTPFTYKIPVRMEEGRTYFLNLKSVGVDPKDIISVMFKTNPADAKVFIDEKEAGVSGTPIEIPKGTHAIKVLKNGFRKIDRNLEINDKTIFFEYTLESIDPVTVKISSQPIGAEIWLNNSRAGTTNKQTMLLPGEYELKISSSGYLDKTEKIVVTEDGKNEFSYILLKSSGTLKLTIEPVNATVFLNKENTNGKKELELSPSFYKLEIKAPHYYDLTENIEIKSNQVLEKQYKLQARTGKLQVSFSPDTATLEVRQGDKLVKAVTSALFLKDIVEGEYLLVCKAQGYQQQEKRVIITENALTDISIDLVRGQSQPQTVLSSGNPVQDERMIFVEGGDLSMGTEASYGTNATHPVSVSSFYICKYEVTQKEWQELMGYNLSVFKGENRPVDCVNWYDAVEYCNKKSIKEGLNTCYTIVGANVMWDTSKNGYRLPTEAEWELAGQGGKYRKGYQYCGSDNIDEIAWYEVNSDKKGNTSPDYGSHAVGGKKPNELGLYDMSGNLWEWCWDWKGDFTADKQINPQGPASGTDKILKGGSWYSQEQNCRVQKRNYNTPDSRFNYIGFRLVRNSK